MKIKFVKRANTWTVTRFVNPTTKVGKIKQEQQWFSTEVEAKKYIDENKDNV